MKSKTKRRMKPEVPNTEFQKLVVQLELNAATFDRSLRAAWDRTDKLLTAIEKRTARAAKRMRGLGKR